MVRLCHLIRMAHFVASSPPDSDPAPRPPESGKRTTFPTQEYYARNETHRISTLSLARFPAARRQHGTDPNSCPDHRECPAREGLKQLINTALGGNLGVPSGAQLGGAELGLEVHPDDPEPPGIALGPLEVVEQRPHEVAPQIDPRGEGVVGGPHVIAQEREPVVVGYRPVGLRAVRKGGTV